MIKSINLKKKHIFKKKVKIKKKTLVELFIIKYIIFTFIWIPNLTSSSLYDRDEFISDAIMRFFPESKNETMSELKSFYISYYDKFTFCWAE